VVLQIFPAVGASLHSPMRRGRLAGQGGPLHACHAGVMPAAMGTDMNAGLHALRLRRHADLNLVGSIGGIANAESCVSVAGDHAPAHVPAVMRGAVLRFGNVGGAGPSRELKTKAACGFGLLFLARWIRLPRRHVGPRRRVWPDRLRHPRGLRGAAEAQQPREEMGAMLLKHQQDGFGGEG
jgi:hypothetical protein